MNLIPIDDQAQILGTLSRVSALLSDQASFNLQWIAQHQWSVVPVESASHFDERDATRLSLAFSELGFEECLAIATEPVNGPAYFRVRTTGEGLLDFSKECAHFNFVLTPADVSCAVLCTVYEYYIVAGPTKFVRLAVGGDVTAARSRFAKFAMSLNSDDPEWRESEHDRLLGIAKNYEGFNG